MYALTAIAVSLLVTFLFSSYEISSPFYHVRQQLAAIPVPSWGARQNQQAIWLHYIIVVIFCSHKKSRSSTGRENSSLGTSTSVAPVFIAV